MRFAFREVQAHSLTLTPYTSSDHLSPRRLADGTPNTDKSKRDAVVQVRAGFPMFRSQQHASDSCLQASTTRIGAFTPSINNTPHHYQAPLIAKGKIQNRILVFVRTLKQTCSQDFPRAPLAFKNSMTHEFCKSHYLSQFATFFIDVGA